ncbi:MAG TPA: ABC transporter substrate-binding protein [Phototrophicaceae bacterium]|nr:ABC transporter substrate-binding protein [Phototrophicaceae bacterium]
MFKCKRLLFIVLALMLLPLIGIHAQAATETPTPGGTLTFAFSADWGVLDPAATSVTFARNIIQFIYDPLLRKDPSTGAIVPGLAESYEVSTDGKTLTLHLRHDVTFQDGTPFNSAAVKFSFDRIADPALASPYVATIVTPVDSLDTPDDYTVIFHFKQPNAPYLDALTQSELSPVSPTAVQKYGADFGLNPVGTGPFQFVSETPDEEVDLTRNPNYNWAPSYYSHQGPAYLENLVVKNVTDDSTRMALIQSNDIDLVYNALVDQLDSFRSDPSYTVGTGIRSGVPRILIYNTSRFPFDDVATRQALAWAVDRQRMLTDVWGGIGSVPTGILTPGMLGYWADGKDKWPGYDLDKAASMLAAAGWKDTDGDGILDKDGKPFAITYGGTPGFPFDQFGQILENDLTKLGIKVTIQNEEQAAYLADIRAGKWELSSMLFAATDPDVLYTIADSNSIDAAWNTARYSNPQVDALLDQGRTTVDQDQRAQVYEQVQQILLQDMPYVPFYQIEEPYIISSKFKGFRTDSQGFFDFYDTYDTEASS